MRRKQSGMALFFTLIILLVVVMVGVSAMRGSLFHETMAFNSQSEDLTFQAAESAINSVVRQARDVDQGGSAATLLTRLIAGQTVAGCVTLQAGFSEGACSESATDTLDGRATILASSSTQFQLETNAVGYDPNTVVDFEFGTEGNGRFLASTNMPFENTNVQRWRKLGPPSGYFHDPMDLLGDDVEQ